MEAIRSMVTGIKDGIESEIIPFFNCIRRGLRKNPKEFHRKFYINPGKQNSG
jgi:hypothetical protein